MKLLKRLFKKFEVRTRKIDKSYTAPESNNYLINTHLVYVATNGQSDSNMNNIIIEYYSNDESPNNKCAFNASFAEYISELASMYGVSVVYIDNSWIISYNIDALRYIINMLYLTPTFTKNKIIASTIEIVKTIPIVNIMISEKYTGLESVYTGDQSLYTIDINCLDWDGCIYGYDSINDFDFESDIDLTLQNIRALLSVCKIYRSSCDGDIIIEHMKSFIIKLSEYPIKYAEYIQYITDNPQDFKINNKYDIYFDADKLVSMQSKIKIPDLNDSYYDDIDELVN